MNNTIKIKLLSDSETLKLLQSPKFNRIKPDECKDCGYRTHGHNADGRNADERNADGEDNAEFVRRIFIIKGVKKDKYSDDVIQKHIGSFFYKSLLIFAVFFKSSDDQFYADTASCPKCQSTNIIFDLEITDDLLREMSQLSGHPPEKIRRNIEKRLTTKK